MASVIATKCSKNFVDHRQHGRAVERHPGGGVGLLEVAARRQRGAAGDLLTGRAGQVVLDVVEEPPLAPVGERPNPGRRPGELGDERVGRVHAERQVLHQ
jgi:hypothetical protein